VTYDAETASPEDDHVLGLSFLVRGVICTRIQELEEHET
jgi:hypothetical protein